jgi:hypothetical protein
MGVSWRRGWGWSWPRSGRCDSREAFLRLLSAVPSLRQRLALPESPVPGLWRRCQLISLPRPAQQTPRYCLSFTAAGLRPDLAAVIAGVHLEVEGDWARTKAVVLERNALQTRSASTAKRLESELRQRLQRLNGPQLKLLARGSSDERSAMAWLAVLKRIEIAADLAREVLEMKLSSQDPELRRSDMAAFYEDCERDHPELAALAPSSQQKVRSALLQMLRDAGLLAGKAGKSGTLGTVQRPLLSPQVQELVSSDDPALMAGFLLHAPAKPEAKPPPKPKAKPKAKAAAKTASQKAAPTRRAKP